jgi:hypothetical protein
MRRIVTLPHVSRGAIHIHPLRGFFQWNLEQNTEGVKW